MILGPYRSLKIICNERYMTIKLKITYLESYDGDFCENSQRFSQKKLHHRYLIGF